MKHLYQKLTASAMLVASMLAVSCELETSNNGKLDGFWHLEEIDTIKTGGIYDLSESYLFWSIQGKLLSVSEKNFVQKVGMEYDHAYLPEYLFRFSRPADSLVLSEPILSNRMAGDEVVTDPEVLRPYGINALEEHFKVEQLNSKRMVLSTDSLRLWLRRF